MSRVDILLATYNGARFVREQLASISAQTHSDWHLMVRDDGSSDDTLAIVRKWAASVAQPVTIVEDGESGLGASLNFARLLERSDAPYFACCDQDDVWLPQKLETMLAPVQQAEAGSDAARPVLGFCDLFVVDEQLNPIAPSYWRLSNLDPDRDTKRLADIMVRNVVTGCATLGNRALREAALPIPAGARMHDWWLAMPSRTLGPLVPVRESLIQSRQHGSNTIGANKSTSPALVKRFFEGPTLAWGRTIRALENSQNQAGAFVERFGSHLGPSDLAILSGYADLPQHGFAARKRFLWRHQIGRHQPLFRLAFLAAG